MVSRQQKPKIFDLRSRAPTQAEDHQRDEESQQDEDRRLADEQEHQQGAEKRGLVDDEYEHQRDKLAAKVQCQRYLRSL